MDKMCKHFHVDGVMHKPCYQCRSEAQQARIAELEAMVKVLENKQVGLDVLLFASPQDTQAKFDELQAKFNRLSGLAKEYDEAKDDADWESPHPIFCMAQDVDNLNAKLEKAIEALKYLDERFDNESWNCIICGHAESTSESDSAIYLKEVLKELTQRMML